MLRMKRLPPNSFRSEASGSPIGASAGLETSLCCCSTTSPRPWTTGICQPALVVHGNKDVVVRPINAFILAQHLPDAQLVMYPDASHGAQSQHARVFLKHARMFLNG